ncbi:MAG: hypothetical protein E6L02_05280 [Thaumarchaeota archaeon]|nr:MAG: hypothetical protein E6L02_05280 [Nitrososphaerota archaeon]
MTPKRCDFNETHRHVEEECKDSPNGLHDFARPNPAGFACVFCDQIADVYPCKGPMWDAERRWFNKMINPMGHM